MNSNLIKLHKRTIEEITKQAFHIDIFEENLDAHGITKLEFINNEDAKTLLAVWDNLLLRLSKYDGTKNPLILIVQDIIKDCQCLQTE